MAIAGLAVAAVLGFAGCGGGGSNAGVASLTGSGGKATTTTTVSKASAQKLWNEWAACMRQHGVQMADPVLNNDGLPSGGINLSSNGGPKAAAVQASEACQPQMNAAVKASGKSPGSTSPADQAKAQKFSKCMRAHGVPDFPDPQTSANGGAIKIQGSSGGGSAPPGDLNADSPAFQKAQKACRSLLPGKAGQNGGLQVSNS
jgi:hypothetical protein